MVSRPSIDIRPGNSTTDATQQDSTELQNRCKRPHFMSPLRVTTVGTWNVRTLCATGAVGTLMHELSNFRWDIIGLAETHWTETQEISYHEYKILNSGNTDKHSVGVALLLTKEAHRCLLSYNPVNDRIISARLSTLPGAVTVMQVYAPTAGSTYEEIEEFYSQLQQEIGCRPPYCYGGFQRQSRGECTCR